MIDAIGWPFDNIFMLATGIAIVFAKQLEGWKRFVPLFVGFWFPITVVVTHIILGSGNAELMIVNSYSVIGWALLGLTVYLSSLERERKENVPVIALR